jgi:hypothetical protein
MDHTAYRYFKERMAANKNEAAAIRDVVGVLHSEWYQVHVEQLLERVNIHIEDNAIIRKLVSARHAGLTNEQLGAIFCAECDKVACSITYERWGCSRGSTVKLRRVAVMRLS